MQQDIAIATCGALNGTDYVMGMWDVSAPPSSSYAPPNALWNPAIYHHSSWTQTNLGNIYGITIDATGNTYVCAHGLYRDTYAGNYINEYGVLGGGPLSLAAAGTVYKIDAVTGAASVFAVLPQQATTVHSGWAGQTGPGLGNIAYDSVNNQFFVSNLEDGKIYRLSNTGAILDNYDPGSPDNGAAGMPPTSERVWGLAVADGKVHYAIWKGTGNVSRIETVNLSGTGGFGTADPHTFTIAYSGTDSPIADIAISFDGTKMALGQRTMTFSSTQSYNHNSRTFVAEKNGSGNWVPTKTHKTGNASNAPVQGEAYGGVAWGVEGGVADQIVWSTSADMAHRNGPHGIYGRRFTGFDPYNSPSNSAQHDAYRIPFDPTWDHTGPDVKGLGGDVEIMMGTPIPPVDTVGIGNLVFFDINNNGKVDSTAEVGIDGVIVEVYDASATPEVSSPIQSMSTTGGGCYLFQGLTDASSYKVHIHSSNFQSGGVLEGFSSSTGAGTGSFDDGVDENGIDSATPSSGGITSAAVALAVGTEPDDTVETGKNGTTDSPDLDNDLTIDFGFYVANPVGIGNLVFEDFDNDGKFEPVSGDLGIDGVTVNLERKSGSTYAFVTSTVTSGGGCYSFTGLPGGTYRVVVDKTNFDASAVLDGKYSSTGAGGDTQADDDADENGLDSASPVSFGIASTDITLTSGGEPDNTMETGKQGSTDSPDTSIDYTVDFGFNTPPTPPDPKPKTFGDWVTEQGLGTGADQPSSNADGDDYDNLCEYAFCLDPTTGANNAFCLIWNPDDRNMQLQFHRRLEGLTDVDYCLAYPRGPGVWQEILILTEKQAASGDYTPEEVESALIVKPEPSKDGISEIVTIDYVNELLGRGDCQQYRMVAKLDCDGDGVVDAKCYTEAQGFCLTTVEKGECETMAHPFMRKPPFCGTISGVSSMTVNFSGSASGTDFGSSGNLLLAGESYYLEIMDGVNEGARFDITSGSGTTVTLASDSNVLTGPPYNTVTTPTGLPAGLIGSKAAIVPHVTLDYMFPPENLLGSTSASTADKILIPNGSGWDQYWVFDNAGTNQWVQSGAGLTDRGSTIIPACQGFFFHPFAKENIVASIGRVREHDFCCPYGSGHTMIAPGILPVEGHLTPYGIGLKPPADGTIQGSNNPATSDKILQWNRDGQSASDQDGWCAYWFTDHTPFEQWSKTGDVSLSDYSNKQVLDPARSFMLSATVQNLDYKMEYTGTPPVGFDNGCTPGGGTAEKDGGTTVEPTDGGTTLDPTDGGTTK